MEELKEYIIRADRKTEEDGTVDFKVMAKSKEEALKIINDGDGEEIDWSVGNMNGHDSNFRVIKVKKDDKLDEVETINTLLERPNSLDLVLAVQKIIHTNFTVGKIEDMTHIELDKHLFERVNLGIEELVEANRELKHRKPHRVTVEGETVNANEAKTDMLAFKKELIDATQIITSVMSAIGMNSEEFFSLWRGNVEKIKHLSVEKKYAVDN